MSWPINPRPAKSLIVLRDQINKLAPKRSKISDGLLARTEHTVDNPNSDHEPHVRDGEVGVVTGMDITHDPTGGVDGEMLANSLVASKDRRLKYIIWNKRIISGTEQKQPAWVWRSYFGKNPHNHHMHISVKPDKASYDMTTIWELLFGKSGGASTSAPSGSTSSPRMPVLMKGAEGQHVEALQTLLNKHGDHLIVDGVFGNDTRNAVINFQRRNGLVADGKAGPYTFDKLRENP